MNFLVFPIKESRSADSFPNTKYTYFSLNKRKIWEIKCFYFLFLTVYFITKKVNESTFRLLQKIRKFRNTLHN